jgi:hypothetical protein
MENEKKKLEKVRSPNTKTEKSLRRKNTQALTATFFQSLF